MKMHTLNCIYNYKLIDINATGNWRRCTMQKITLNYLAQSVSGVYKLTRGIAGKVYAEITLAYFTQRGLASFKTI